MGQNMNASFINGSAEEYRVWDSGRWSPRNLCYSLTFAVAAVAEMGLWAEKSGFHCKTDKGDGGEVPGAEEINLLVHIPLNSGLDFW